MGFVPHQELPLGVVRPMDIYCLLLAGAAWELAVRLLLLNLKRKSSSLIQREKALKALDAKVLQSRKLGPQAFVETSKLEREQLSEQKALATLAEQRTQTVAHWQRNTRNLTTILSALIFVIYYGIPVLELAADQIAPRSGEILSEDRAEQLAVQALQGFLFPIGFVGIGMRISKMGLPNPKTGLGALLVFWSAQVTVGKIMDGVEPLVLVSQH